jgi:hypothetical protein
MIVLVGRENPSEHGGVPVLFTGLHFERGVSS